jgi:hypothetical protein
MTKRDGPTLKSFFEKGDIPKESEFADLIDTVIQGDTSTLDSALVSVQTLINMHSLTHHDFTYSVKNYGAVGDGITDDTNSIQSAINACSIAGGGTVHIPEGVYATRNLRIKSGVFLSGSTSGILHGYRDETHFINVTTLKALEGGAVIEDDSDNGAWLCGISGLNIIGLGAETPGKGIWFHKGIKVAIKQVFVSNFADEGINIDYYSIACFVEDVQITSCLLDRDRDHITGAIDIHGNDHWLSRIESTTSTTIEGHISSEHLYCVGIVIRGQTCMCNSLIGELSDMGIAVLSFMNKFTLCRADQNYGHGWYINGNMNMFSTCDAIENSKEETNTYSGWYIDTNGFNCTLVGCSSNNLVGYSYAQKYGFEDHAPTIPAYITSYIGCFATGNISGFYSMPSYSGSSPLVLKHLLRVLDETKEPDITGTEFITLWDNYETSTLITNFIGGIEGQDLWIIGSDFVTLQHNYNIQLTTKVDKILTGGVLYHFKNYNGRWFETGYTPRNGRPNLICGYDSEAELLDTDYATSNDERGIIEITTGDQTPVADTYPILQVTLEHSMVIGNVAIQPTEASDNSLNSLGVQFYIKALNITTNIFEVYHHVGLQPNTKYALTYLVTL